MMDQAVLRQIPKMDRLLAAEPVSRAAEGLPRALVRSALQEQLELLRRELMEGKPSPSEAELLETMSETVRKAGRCRLTKAVNATGIVLHTNLGRAILASSVADHVADVSACYSNLEYNLEKGSRGSRHDHVEKLLCQLTGAEAAMVVNNNAAAVFLMLNTLAQDKTVAISRGELVEIGGSFRVPEIMAAGGAHLLEVGTTNKTHLHDYIRALEQEGAEALLKVHTSNFVMVGFTESVQLPELHELAASHGVPLLYDLGSGMLVRPETLGLSEGCYVPEAVKYADVCSFSGDKLLGAGQAGIILGKRNIIEAMKKNQLARMLRVDKMTLASLEGTLRLYLEPELAIREIPVLSMLSQSRTELRSRAEHLTHRLRGVCPKCLFEPVDCIDEPGGGSLPGLALDGAAVAVTAEHMTAAELEQALRSASVPVIARISSDRLLLSLRTIRSEDEPAILDAFSGLAGCE